MKHLEALGKGEYNYDYKDDILMFKIKDREYDRSIEFENIVLDIDKEGFITGIRIFDASELFNLSKLALKTINEFRFDSKVEDKIVNIQLKFVPILRNKPLIRQGQDIVRESREPLQNSEALCTIA